MKTYRLKIEFHLESPVILTSLTTFDGILSYGAYRQALTEGCSEAEAIHLATHNLPLRKIFYKDNTFIYAASVALYTPLNIQNICITRPQSINRYQDYVSEEYLRQLVDAEALNQTRGVWKQMIIRYKAIDTDSVGFIADVTDLKRLNAILNHIEYIGKKKALGFGKVRGYTPSYADNEPIIRYIPAYKTPMHDLRYKALEGYAVFNTTVRPPYWKGEDEPCVMVEM